MATVTIDDVVIEGATFASKTGGWNAPEETVETGFEYSSYVAAEPWELTLTAWVDAQTLTRLERIHEEGDPFPASINQFALEDAKFPSGGFSVEDEAARRSHFEIQFTLEEVVFAETETAEVEFDAPGGSMSSGADSTTPSTAGSEESSEGFGASVVSTLSGFADSMQSSLFG